MTEDAPKELAGRVQQVLERYCRQNGHGDELAGTIETVAVRLANAACQRAARRERWSGAGEPPEMNPEEVAALVNEALADLHGAEWLTGPVKQLVKGCGQATRQQCRESYREVDGAGVCRRQLLAKALERVSGTHCVDCPYWTQLTAGQHESLLAEAWVGAGGAAELAAHREVFLPEDFRALRRLMFGPSAGHQ